MRKPSQLAGKTGDASSSSGSANLNRRRFLFVLGATSAGTAAAPALAAASEVAAATSDTKAASGYRETEHVRDYYDSARI
ncbi:MAG TPA: transcriptional initiation protein Tat [Casimicrobiaceae bacterium]|jgi:hypothetical protein